MLADCLAAHPSDEAQAFLTFEAERRRRAARVQAMSRLDGRVYQLRPPSRGRATARSACCRRMADVPLRLAVRLADGCGQGDE